MHRSRSVRGKVLLVSLAILAALVGLSMLVMVRVVGPSFEDLERDRAGERGGQVASLVAHEVRTLDVLVQDWAYWDDTYDYVRDGNADYQSANLIEETFVAAELNLLLIRDDAGRRVWGMTYDLNGERPMILPEFAAGAGLPDRLTALSDRRGDGVRGLVRTTDGPMLVAVRPILTSMEAGPPRGHLIMGRLLTDRKLGDLGSLLALPLEARMVEDASLPPAAVALVDAVHAGGTAADGPAIAVAPIGAESIAVHVLLDDVFGRPFVVLSTRLPRTISAAGTASLNMALLMIAGVGGVLIVVFVWSQQVLILGPLNRLTGHIRTVAETVDLSQWLPEGRDDELGTVATAFNQMQRRVAQLAYYDTVTGLPNRRLFEDRAEQILRMARRSGQCVGILFLDLDGFKAVNDSRGHSEGDALLRAVAGELEALVRDLDTVARFGGDEFVIVLHDLDSTSRARDLAARILGRFSRPFRVGEGMLFSTASIGVAVFPHDGETLEALVRKADAAMYQAKGEGGHRAAFLDRRGQEQTEHLLELEQAFREALSNEALFLCFQPQVSLADGAVVGHEALVRWRHPDQGVMTAARFIHLADRGGLYAALDAWVLRMACVALARGMADDGTRLDRVSVNICARHVDNEGLVGLVAGVLRDTGAPPDRLVVEVTETVMISRPDEARRVLAALRDLGVLVAIDDFGTGYASLSALHRFPADIVKIDRSFITDVPDDPTATAIVRAILTMARALGLEVVAEGIEVEAQSAFLREVGCRYGQGYLFGRPVGSGEGD